MFTVGVDHLEITMEKQNVTLSISKVLLRRVKILAIERQTSLSALLSQTLQEIVTQSDRYEEAMQRHLQLLDNPTDLGTKGSATWNREQYHER